MSYSTGEAAILDVLRLHKAYSPKNTGRGTFGLLDKGGSDRYVILRMGAAANEQLAITTAQTTWTTELMVYRAYVDDGDSAVKLQGHVQEVIEHLEQYPTLNGAVADSQIVTVGAMEQTMMVANGPMWLRSTIAIQWQEEREITYIG